MQTLAWYTNRLRHMSRRELAWRARTFIRDRADRPRLTLGMVPAAEYDEFRAEAILERGLPLCVRAQRPADDPALRSRPEWRDRLIREADAVAGHRFTFFGLERQHLGDPIDWNRDHESGTPAPMRFAPAIDYRDYRVTGDAKVVWEPSRHHQLVVLGRAYRATGDERYACEAVRQIDSWLGQCPFGIGMQWRSPLEIAIRAINWVWTLDLIRPAGIVRGRTAARLLNALHLHIWEVARKYSRGSSANNHRIGEAAAVFITTSCLPGLNEAARRRSEAREILEEEILAQTHDDGGTREQAFGYHLFVLQFLFLSAVVARRAGHELSRAYHARLALMFEFAASMLDGGPAPSFGDADDGHVLDLGDGRDARGWLAAGAGLLDRPDLLLDPDGFGEISYWLLHPSEDPPATGISPSRRLTSKAFPHSGYYLLQCGTRGGADAVSVLFDCGELGFGPIAAHGHADALALTLRAFGEDILVDPGTYDYFRYPAWREYFRSTRAHNTIAVDGRNQSAILGPFMWGHRARAACTNWQPSPSGGRVDGVHDGYANLADPVYHRRSVELDGDARTVTIADHLEMQGEHTLAMCFHFSERCAVRVAAGTIEAATHAGRVCLIPDRRLSIHVLRASSEPIGGWVSRGYHRRSPATTVFLSGTFHGETRLSTRIRIGTPAPPRGAQPC